MGDTFLEMAGDYVLVMDSPRDVTLDGITLPDNVRQQDMVFGLVIAVGEKMAKAKPEDRVCYGPYAGKTVALDGIEFRILREGQIEAFVRTKKKAQDNDGSTETYTLGTETHS